jgi:hypothetical protein
MTQQTAEVPRRKIPPKMWEFIADAERRAKFANQTIREQLIDTGAQHGFSETDLIKRGIITPREKPNPEADSEHHR